MTTNNNAAGFVVFEKVGDDQRLFRKVAQQIEHTVLTGELKPGDMLPSERILREQFGVSRTVIREALKALEVQGLLEVQHGRGAIVATPRASSVADSMVRYVRIQESPLWALNELRSILEIEIAVLATERRTDQDLAELAQLFERMSQNVGSPSEYAELDMAFHQALTASAHNPLFSVVLDPFRTLLRESRRLGATVPDAQRRSLEVHKRVLGAIEVQDPEAARNAMSEHCSLVAALLEEGMARSQETKDAS
jgi:GntR family transcriptional repressor for pyruvate dehydrogenase complex